MDIRYEPILGAVVAVGSRRVASPEPIKIGRIDHIIKSAEREFVSDTHRDSRRGRAKLNIDTVTMIRTLYDRGVRICDIARELQMSNQHVGSVARREIWRNV